MYRWRTPSPRPLPPSPQPQKAGVIVERPVLKHTENSQLAWQIQLKKMEISHGGQNIAAHGVQEALIYAAEGKPVLRMTAQQVTGDTARRDFQVSGDVRVVSYRGTVITTDTVEWHQADQTMSCPGEVTLYTREAVVITSGLTYYVNQDVVECPNQVTMYAGNNNKVIGEQLRYDVATADFTLQNVRMILNVEEAKEQLREVMSG